MLRATGDAEAATRQIQLARTTAMALGAAPLMLEIRTLGRRRPRSASSGR